MNPPPKQNPAGRGRQAAGAWLQGARMQTMAQLPSRSGAAERRLLRLDAHLHRRPIAQPCAAAATASGTVTATLHGRAALSLQNADMEISILSGGGFIGAVQLTTGDPKTDVNPMRVPSYQTIDPHSYDPGNAEHVAAYGSDVQGRLMAGYMGHFTCFPQFGNSPDEFEAVGYGQHGELLTVVILQIWPSFPCSMEEWIPLCLLEYSARFARTGMGATSGRRRAADDGGAPAEQPLQF